METSLIVGIIISVIILLAGVIFGVMKLTSLPKAPKPLPFKFTRAPQPILSTTATTAHTM